MRRGSIPHPARLLAGVAVVVLVAVVASRFVGMRSRVDERPELRELVAALDGMPTRLNEARWTGGFAYKRPPTPVRGGGVALSPDAKLAAALIEKRARTSPVAANMAALGTAYVALGEWNRAVDALEEAVESAPDVAAYQSDLSAAYLARSSALGTAEDLARALAAATRALARADRLPEAHFNRSLALRRLALNVQERAARTAHLAVEPAGPWAEESIDRLRELRAHDAGPQAAGEAKDRQARRERIEDRLLGEWGVAIEADDGAAASRALGQASELADRLVADGGDAMARDEIALIRRAQRESRAMLLDLARGHRLYAAAQERWNANELTRANELMTLAADHLRRAGSPYWRWSAVFRAVLLQTRGDAEAAVRLLTSVPMPDASRRYLAGG